MNIILRNRGIAVRSALRSIDAITADVPAADLAGLAADPLVLSISSDAPVTSSGAAQNIGGDGNGKKNATTAETLNLLRGTLGLDRTALDGAGVGVAVVDSGIASAPDFGRRISAFYDFTRGGVSAPPTDEYGHGTHVAGVIGGNGRIANDVYKGIAPRVRLIGLKVLNERGEGRTSDVIAAIDFAIANKTRLAIDIINLSLGHPILEDSVSDPLVQAVEAAVRAGIIVLAAAGNLGTNPATGLPGYAGVTSPGNAPSAMTVGALTMQNTLDRYDDRVADYSSRGPTWYDAFAKPDFTAPGDQLGGPGMQDGPLSGTAIWTRTRGGVKHATLSGTSMATGVAAGVAALVVQANRHANPFGPRLTPNAVKAILQYTCFRMFDGTGAEYDALTEGAGALNALGAVTLARAIDTSAALGTGWLTIGIQPTTTIGARALTWGQTVYWGRSPVFPLNPIDTNAVAWGRDIVWGTRIVWGKVLLWGNTTDFRSVDSLSRNIVWGTNIVWPNNIVWGNTLVGTRHGQNVTWGSVDPEGTNIVWGNVANQTLIKVTRATGTD